MIIRGPIVLARLSRMSVSTFTAVGHQVGWIWTLWWAGFRSWASCLILLIHWSKWNWSNGCVWVHYSSVRVCVEQQQEVVPAGNTAAVFTALSSIRCHSERGHKTSRCVKEEIGMSLIALIGSVMDVIHQRSSVSPQHLSKAGFSVGLLVIPASAPSPTPPPAPCAL